MIYRYEALANGKLRAVAIDKAPTMNVYAGRDALAMGVNQSMAMLADLAARIHAHDDRNYEFYDIEDDEGFNALAVRMMFVGLFMAEWAYTCGEQLADPRTSYVSEWMHDYLSMTHEQLAKANDKMARSIGRQLADESPQHSQTDGIDG